MSGWLLGTLDFSKEEKHSVTVDFSRKWDDEEEIRSIISFRIPLTKALHGKLKAWSERRFKKLSEVEF